MKHGGSGGDGVGCSCCVGNGQIWVLSPRSAAFQDSGWPKGWFSLAYGLMLKSFTAGAGYKLGLIIPYDSFWQAVYVYYFYQLCSAGKLILIHILSTFFSQKCIHSLLKFVYFSCCFTRFVACGFKNIFQTSNRCLFSIANTQTWN